jgi:hypothetical protein
MPCVLATLNIYFGFEQTLNLVGVSTRFLKMFSAPSSELLNGGNPGMKFEK